MNAPLSTLQDAIVEHLANQEYFSIDPSIAVLSERLGDLETKIQTQIRKLGIVAIVTTPVGANESENAIVPLIRPVVIVTIIENVVLNRTSKGTRQPADKVAGGVAYYLHQKEEELGYQLTFQEIRLQADVVSGDENSVAYSAIFQVQNPIVLAEPVRFPALREDGGEALREDGGIKGREA